MSNKDNRTVRAIAKRREILRTSLPRIILKAVAWVAYPWLFALVKVSNLISKRLKIYGFWMYYEEYLLKNETALTEATEVAASAGHAEPIRSGTFSSYSAGFIEGFL